MVAIQGKKDNQIKQPVHVDNDGNIILSSSSIIGINDVDTISTVTSVTTLGSITNTVTVNGTVAATQSGTWNIGTLTDITNTVDTREMNPIPTNVYSSGYQTLAGGTTSLEFIEHTFAYNASYLKTPGYISIGNISAFYPLSVTLRQVLTVGGSPIRINTHNYIAPAVEKIRPTSTAYSSCVTYNKTGAVWTDESVNFDNENGFDAEFPITEVDDAIYFGSKAKFNSISLNITTEAVINGTLVWEFWNGSAWVNPAVLLDNTSDGTNPLTNNGGKYHIVVFEALTNWTANQPDGANMINQYWMRIRCSAFTSKTTNPVIRTVILKPVVTNPLSTFDISEIFPTANATTIITVNPVSDIDPSHEIVYTVSLGVV